MLLGYSSFWETSLQTVWIHAQKAHDLLFPKVKSLAHIVLKLGSSEFHLTSQHPPAASAIHHLNHIHYQIFTVIEQT